MKIITNSQPVNISDSFKKDFLENIKKGTNKQLEQLNVIKSKIFYFSLAIQQSIQNIVEKEKPLLSANGIPYTQNSCCNTGNINTLQYFIDKDQNILNFNNIVEQLKNALYDYNNIIYAPYLIDPLNTKFIYPKLENIYNEETIYLAVIKFCNFDNDLQVSDELIKFCLNKPEDYNEKDTIEEKINTLKKNGVNYTEQMMMQLLDIVNRNNILDVDLVNDSVSAIQKLRKLLEYCEERNSIIDKEFIQKFKSLLDTYAIDGNEENDDLREFKNFLASDIDSCKKNIVTFIKQYGKISSRKYNKCIEFFNKISDFKESEDSKESDELFFKSINYMKKAFHYISSIFPNIIINKVNFDNVKIPSYWGLSSRHVTDIKTIISDNYISFKSFYDNNTLKDFLTTLSKDTVIIKLFLDITPIFINIEKNDGTIIYPLLDKRSIKLLYEYYFFKCLCNYISLTDNVNISNVKIPRDTSVRDILGIEETDEDNNQNDQIVYGDQVLNKENVSKLLFSYYEILDDNKREINYTTGDIIEKVNRSKDKEKDNVTKKLGDLTIEEREIENLFKKHKLERWDKGLQKGLVEYVGKTYDEEKMEEERLTILETRARTQDVSVEQLEEIERTDMEIEREENDISGLPEDDDYNEDNDDAYMLDYNDD